MSHFYELTAIDVAAFKKANLLLVGLNRRNDRSGAARVELVKEVKQSPQNPFPQDIRHEIPAPVTVAYNYRHPDNAPACWSHNSLFASQHCEASSILATLRAGDGIAFEFYPDAFTNQYLARAGIHGDGLRLKVYRKGHLHAQFWLNDSFCPDNSARMCQGSPMPKSLLMLAEV